MFQVCLTLGKRGHGLPLFFCRKFAVRFPLNSFSLLSPTFFSIFGKYLNQPRLQMLSCLKDFGMAVASLYTRSGRLRKQFGVFFFFFFLFLRTYCNFTHLFQIAVEKAPRLRTLNWEVCNNCVMPFVETSCTAVI